MKNNAAMAKRHRAKLEGMGANANIELDRQKAVVKHHKEVPFRLLEPVPELSCGDADSGNLIVQGDNLHALKALLPRYAGQVKCIYIDPPYNTGNEGWVYNDNVNSPEIRKWLGEVVGKEGETLDRHDRWLCMMYPRLVLLRQFLRDDGAILYRWMTTKLGLYVFCWMRFLDLKLCHDNRMAKDIHHKNSAKHFSEMHDYVVVYSKKKDVWKRNLLPRSSSAEDDYSIPTMMSGEIGQAMLCNLETTTARARIRSLALADV